MEAKHSYSQSGEDLIVKFLFDALQVKNLSYIDVGAYHPFTFSNTALFYEMGHRGINIEPSLPLFENFLIHRLSDLNLNIGISDYPGETEFYNFAPPTLNTSSKTEADSLVSKGYSVVSVERVKVETLNKIINQYCQGVFPDFLSIDTEGTEQRILQTVDLKNNGPKVICCETIQFANTWRERCKDGSLIEFITSNGYTVYADTYINTIFVKSILLTP